VLLPWTVLREEARQMTVVDVQNDSRALVREDTSDGVTRKGSPQQRIAVRHDAEVASVE